jgi:hypothetical protein
MASSATLQTPHSPHIQQLPSCRLVYFYSAPLVWFYSALDSFLASIVGQQKFSAQIIPIWLRHRFTRRRVSPIGVYTIKENALELIPNAKFELENGTSLLMAKAALGMVWLCAFGYMLCYHHLGRNLVLSFLAGLGSGILQFSILVTLAFMLFHRRVNARLAARASE